MGIRVQDEQRKAPTRALPTGCPTTQVHDLPQMTLTLLSATAFRHNNPNATQIALGLFIFSWIAQFVGHYFAEGRAPALLDNLSGALVLAPFFVHLELLFPFGFKPELHKQINNLAAIELTRIRKLQGEKKRSAEVKKAQ